MTTSPPLRTLARIVVAATRAVAVGALVLACAPAPGRATVPIHSSPAPTARWLVLAPHPDDEVLIAGGLLRRAAEANEGVAVVVMTNGDFDCVHDGLARQAETVRGLAALGIPEERVTFLGYPDGNLGRLGVAVLPPVARNIDGACASRNTTYGGRGRGGADYHRMRTGSSAAYTRENVVADLTSLLRELGPHDVYTTHPDDTHPDHAATYALFREALDRLPTAPRVHRAIVHNGDCWPMSADRAEPCPPTPIDPPAPTPPLSGRLAGYVPSERSAVPESCLDPDRTRNPKLRAIAAHASQTRGTWDSYLFAFARRDEPFFTETFERDAGRWRRPRSRVELKTEEAELANAERRPLASSLPLSLRVSLPPPSTTVSLQVLGDDTGDYRIVVDPQRNEARLHETRAGDLGAPMKVWPLPHDLWASGRPEPFELSIEERPEDGDVAEISLSCRGALIGAAVAVRPRRRGEWLSLNGVATAARVVLEGAIRR